MGIFGGEVIEFFSEKNVVKVYVGVDEGEFRPVGRVLEGSSDDLEHGCYASTAGNHANVTREGGGVLEEALGATDLDFVAYFEEGDIAGDVALFVRLGRVRCVRERGGGNTFIKRSKWPRSSSLLVGV